MSSDSGVKATRKVKKVVTKSAKKGGDVGGEITTETTTTITTEEESSASGANVTRARTKQIANGHVENEMERSALT